MSNIWPKKITKHSKEQEKPQSEETKQESEPDSDTIEILKLSDQEFENLYRIWVWCGGR